MKFKKKFDNAQNVLCSHNIPEYFVSKMFQRLTDWFWNIVFSGALPAIGNTFSVGPIVLDMRTDANAV